MANRHPVLDDAIGTPLRWSLLYTGYNPPLASRIRPTHITEETVAKVIAYLNNRLLARIVAVATIATNSNDFPLAFQRHGCPCCPSPWGVVLHFPKAVVKCGCVVGEICLLNHIMQQWKVAQNLVAQTNAPPTVRIQLSCPKCNLELFPLDDYVRQRAEKAPGPGIGQSVAAFEERFFAKIDPPFLDRIWTLWFFPNNSSMLKIDARVFQQLIQIETSYFSHIIANELEEEGIVNRWQGLLDYNLFTQNIIADGLRRMFDATDGQVCRLRAFYAQAEEYIYRYSWNRVYGRPVGDNLTQFPPRGTPQVVCLFVTRLICRVLVRGRIDQRIAF
ncbi:hypothetical protein K490DRAFT_53579 [Saccharata proteae CBS 121410]|uniref:Uncharacterized protein n=1 Tax=Saccharata proteae CBS 121410 TaxID=1314787 RepID=A0A9P4I015_9PEZI|nr:hypothetical protein K490DRAFT_53579 [Saccharata proteae CBS 121410]